MRHRNHSNRLSQKSPHAWMMLRSMLTSLLLHEQIRTTKKRAQVLRPMVDKILTIGKTDRPDLAIRRINQVVTHPNASRKILEVFKPRYADRTSGFTRTTPVGMRVGDGAKLVDMMLVEGKDVVIADDKSQKMESKAKTPKATKTTKTKSAALSSQPSASPSSSR